MNKLRKYFGKPSNVYESFSPFYYTLKFFGLASYNLNFKSGQMKTSGIHYIMMMCFFLVYLFFYAVYLLIDPTSYSPEGKSVLTYGFLFFYHFQYITSILIIIYNFLKRKNVEKLFKLLETFDDHVEKKEWKFKVNHEQNYWILIFWIGLHIISLMVAYTLQMSWISTVTLGFKEYIAMVFYCFILKAFFLSTLQFTFGVHCVASRFDVLNQNARYLICSIIY